MDYLFFLIGEAVKFILHCGWRKFLSAYWVLLCFDCTRYVITDFLVLTKKLFFANPAPEEAFGQFLLAQRPLVSLIICAYNEESNILKTINSALEQTYNNLQIVVVDDGSTDRTYDLCRTVMETEPRLELFRLAERTGKSSATNYALNFCRGEYIFIVDSDSSYDRDAFFEVLKKFGDPQVGAVGGNIRARNRHKNVITHLQDLEYQLSISVGRIISSWWDILFIVSGGFGAFRKEVLQHLGGYDIGPGEDFDLTIEARKTGWKIVFASQARCLTNVPDTVWKLTKQRLRWDPMLIRTQLRKHPDLYIPFNPHIGWSTFFAAVDNVFYPLFLTVIFVIYVVYVYYHFYSMFLVIIIGSFLLYIVTTFLECLVSLALSDQLMADLELLLYVPLFPFYTGLFLRVIRIIACLGEFFFRYSYRDHYVPARVSKGHLKW